MKKTVTCLFQGLVYNNVRFVSTRILSVDNGRVCQSFATYVTIWEKKKQPARDLVIKLGGFPTVRLNCFFFFSTTES